MSAAFGIVLSRWLAPDDLIAVLAELLPIGQRVNVAREMPELLNDPGAIRAAADTWVANTILSGCLARPGDVRLKPGRALVTMFALARVRAE